MWLLAMATAGLLVVGSAYTGPAMNPTNAFGWALRELLAKQHGKAVLRTLDLPDCACGSGRLAFSYLFPIQKADEIKACKERRSKGVCLFG